MSVVQWVWWYPRDYSMKHFGQSGNGNYGLSISNGIGTGYGFNTTYCEEDNGSGSVGEYVGSDKITHARPQPRYHRR